jgi:hypothetical protein
MIAFEMAASDPSDIDDSAYADPADADDGDILIAEPPPAEPQTTARAPEPAAVPAMAPAVQPSLEPSLSRPSFERPVEPSPEPPLEPSLEPSLGATLIANGIVRRRQALASDPLAPIRRMSQAEKIALFS